MNFLAHFVIATRFLKPVGPLAAYVAGTALPDLLPLAAERVRLRPAQVEQTAARTEFEAALSAGVSVHLATDAAFHKSAAFADAQAEIGRIVTGAGFEGIRVRRFFAAHVLTELALDSVLLRAEPTLADEFYDAFAAADASAAAEWAEQATGRPLPNLPAVLTRFAQSGYLRGYADNDGVATGFSNLCRRAGQDTFEGENFMRLLDVARQTALMLPFYLPALFAETAAGILARRQELAGTAANASPISLGDD